MGTQASVGEIADFEMVLWEFRNMNQGRFFSKPCLITGWFFVRHDFRICMNMLVVCLCVFAFPD
jgi:hypothetical protein